ncbi:MAG: ribbon-helix-helix protein, CopG family [Coprobacillaceae bacterium]
MGRPKVDKPKKNLTIRIDEDDLKKLENYCKRKNLSKAEAIRQAINELM